jgi:hypothetical protein
MDELSEIGSPILFIQLSIHIILPQRAGHHPSTHPQRLNCTSNGLVRRRPDDRQDLRVDNWAVYRLAGLLVGPLDRTETERSSPSQPRKERDREKKKRIGSLTSKKDRGNVTERTNPEQVSLEMCLLVSERWEHR